MTAKGTTARAEAMRDDVDCFAVGAFTVIRVMTGAPWREHCYVVVHEPSREAVIVDPGAAADRILAVVTENVVSVQHVLLTHAHHDHVGAVAQVCREFRVPCMLHARDRQLLRQAPLYAYRFAGRVIERPAPDVPFADSALSMGGTSVAVRPTPGHTPGGVCFVFPGFLLTGDTILREHVGRTDLPGGDAIALRASVDGLLRDSAPDMLLFPGHGQPWTVNEARTWWDVVSDAPPMLREHGKV